MNEIMISTTLCNLFMGLVCLILILLAIGMVQTFINDRRREKREQEKEAHDTEYHEQRMKDLLSK